MCGEVGEMWGDIRELWSERGGCLCSSICSRSVVSYSERWGEMGKIWEIWGGRGRGWGRYGEIWGESRALSCASRL